MTTMDLVPVENERAVRVIDDSTSSKSSALQLALSEEQIQQLRENREAHRYSQIWTKDPHAARGGYKKANRSEGIDVLTQNLDGSEKEVELGFERVELGPTSNFVGNAMTMGAVDMVQALLQFRRKGSEDHGVNLQEVSEGPRLLKGQEELEAARAAAASARSALGALDMPPVSLSGTFATPDTDDFKQLRIVEWNEGHGADPTIVLLERPYAEDDSCTMTMTTSFEPAGLSIDYVITRKDKHGTHVLKRYRREIKDLTCGLDVDRCRCLLGSGTLDELLASSTVDIKNKAVNVSHSDDSTVICLVLYKNGSSEVVKGPPSSATLDLHLNSAQGANLNVLKSFIRRTRKA